MHRSNTQGIALVIGAAILWGTTGTAQSFATLSLSSNWVGAARLLVAAGFFVVFLTITDRQALSRSRIKSMSWKLILTAAICMALYNLMFFAGVRETGIAVGTAIALGSGPIWAGILQATWMRRLPGKIWWTAVFIAIFGLVLATVRPASLSVQLSAQGIGLCLLSGFSYALYALVSKQLVSTSSAITTTAMVFTSAALIAIPIAWAVSGKPAINGSDIAVLLWLGVIATGVAYLLFNIGLQYVSSATGVALALAEPMAAFVLAIVVVGERFGLMSMCGMALLFAGLYLLVRTER